MKNKNYFQIQLILFACCFFLLFFVLCQQILSFNEQQFYQRIAVVISEASNFSEIMSALKSPSNQSISEGIRILKRYGYSKHLLEKQDYFILFLCSGLIACLLFAFFLCLLFFQYKRSNLRIQGLTEYLKQINAGIYPLHPYKTEDIFSILEDEIYKTVTALRESRREALRAKENLAKNIADLSHQLKTPLTSLSLMAELLCQHAVQPEEQQTAKQILAQTDHLSSLTIALLTLSRIDTGVLQLEPKTVLMEELISCAAEPILPIFKEKQQYFQVQGDLECSLICDIGWTAEGLGNILKNCSEHAPVQSLILLSVYQNPIFTEIVIEDEGEGFLPNDLPHLFERFYKGAHRSKNSIGIGLAIAKSIFAQQNGTILAENRQEGGALFRIKFYKL